MFMCTFGKRLTCLDAETGRTLWRRTNDKDPDLFKAIGDYRPGHGYIGGWKSTVYLKCTDKAVYFIGPQVHHLTAVSAKDGKLLWADNARDLHVVIRDDGLYTIGPQKSQNLTRKLDPLTGKVLATFPASRRACTRSTGSADGIYFRASGGSQRLVTGRPGVQQISPMRPSCLVGVMIANGHMYWVPWTCDCNLQMFGVISCGPAGTFAFGRQAGRIGSKHLPKPGRPPRCRWPPTIGRPTAGTTLARRAAAPRGPTRSRNCGESNRPARTSPPRPSSRAGSPSWAQTTASSGRSTPPRANRDGGPTPGRPSGSRRRSRGSWRWWRPATGASTPWRRRRASDDGGSEPHRRRE